MMYKLIVWFLMMLLVSCSKEEPTTIVGKWLLFEQLADPGDGSGIFRKVVSDRTIDFFQDGTYVANGSFCFLSHQSDQESTGVYDSGGITPDGCQFNGMPFELKISLNLDKSELIIHFFCIEACAQKYKKIK